MSIDEIVAHYIKANRLTHPDDIDIMREYVEEIVTMYEQPVRWVDEVWVDEVKPQSESEPD